MKNRFVTAVLIALPAALFAQQPPAQPPTIASEVGGQLSSAEREVLQVAEEMPEDRYGFAPTSGEFKGVRTFAAQVKHIAAEGYNICSTIKGEKPPADTNGDAGPANLTTKADILKYARDSFAYCRQAFSTINEKNALERIPGMGGRGQTTRLAMATFAAAHPFDHYGQMVVYLRMNGHIPPASQPRPPAGQARPPAGR